VIRINLLTEAKAAAAKKKTPILPTGARLNNIVFVGGLALGILYIAIMGLILTSRRRQLDEDIGRARLEADRLRSIIEEVQGYEQKKANLQAKIDLINSLKINQKGPVRLMDEISKALPDLVWLSSLDVSGGQILMKGRTLSPNAVSTYLENLKKSPYFKEPVFKNLGLEGGGQGIYAWEMTLVFTNLPTLASAGAGPASPAGPAGTAAAPAKAPKT
jgi:type IV pilus assembly protein PilN